MQGFHNLCTENHVIQDPLLTPFGEEQCAALRKTFPYHHDISLIVSSPLRRTIYTAVLSFAPALANGHCRPNIIALPEIQETSDFPCDIGSDLDKLRDEITEKHLPVDLTLVPEGWNIKTAENKWAPSAEALAKRAKEARTYLRERVFELQKAGDKDPQIVILTHGGYLHYFTEDWEDSKTYNGKLRHPPPAKSSSGKLGHSLLSILISWILLVIAFMKNQIDQFPWHAPGTGWHNAEYRSFTFANLDPSNSSEKSNTAVHATQVNGNATVSDYENATLRETAESRDRRGKFEPQQPREVQSELFKAATQGSEKQGLSNPHKVASTEKDAVAMETEEDEEDDEQGGLVRVLTKDSENTDMKNGEAPATDRRGEATADVAAAAVRDGKRRKSSSVTAVAA